MWHEKLTPMVREQIGSCPCSCAASYAASYPCGCACFVLVVVLVGVHVVMVVVVVVVVLVVVPVLAVVNCRRLTYQLLVFNGQYQPPMVYSDCGLPSMNGSS